LVSIKDVARHAGVSDKTVSRVVNGEASVKPATRERVERVIDELGYVPNQAARLMRSNRSSLIGIMTDVVARTANSVELIGGIQDQLAETGHNVLIANTSGTIEGERRVWRTFQEHRIDGVLYATMYHRHIQFENNAPPLPTVMVNCSAPARTDVPSVVPDDYEGGYVATQHAIRKGHKRIGYITLNPQIVAAKLRSAAFRQALEEGGVEYNSDWVAPGYRGQVGKEEMCAYEVAHLMLHQEKKKRPTILLCGNDEIALQVMCAANQLGLSIPDETSIVGFDDFQIISTRTVPKLTTIALPYYDIGRRAADKLIRLLNGEMLSLAADKIPCPLIIRDSG